LKRYTGAVDVEIGTSTDQVAEVVSVTLGKPRSRFVLIFLAIACCSSFANAQGSEGPLGGDESTAPPTTAEMLKKVDQLVQQNLALEKQNRELMEQISTMRQMLTAKRSDPAAEADSAAQAIRQAVVRDVQPTLAEATPPKLAYASYSKPRTSTEAVTRNTSAAYDASLAAIGRPIGSDGMPLPSYGMGQGDEGPSQWGTYQTNLGFKVASTERGDMNIAIYSYARYLNQKALEPTYTSYFGVTTTLQQRQDFQLNKVQIKFLGWVMDKRFRYFLYGWTSNATQGQGAQVVLAGNLNYTFNQHIAIGSGIFSLPGARSVEGNFPFWLGVDTRLIADEYMRPSYSSGVKASGQIVSGLTYQTMIANNLSTLGVSALQLDNDFRTNSTALVWMPTTKEFGAGFGDFEGHQQLATRLAAHFNYSKENKQSQPGTNDPDNTQLRLSDGSIIFTPNLFGPGIAVNYAVYKMTSFDGGLKYHGYALEGEFYLHKLSNFQGPGTSVLGPNSDRGYQLQFSSMVIPRTLQGYLGGSEIIGNFGRPWDFRAGVNYFPYKNRVVRWNTEFLYLYRSPVGYSSVPFAFGGTGPIFHTNLELAF
jgi:hypothetical protein